MKVYGPGESFGELALLYNAPRAATIIAKSDSVLFSLDRETFNHIVKVLIYWFNWYILAECYLLSWAIRFCIVFYV